MLLGKFIVITQRKKYSTDLTENRWEYPTH